MGKYKITLLLSALLLIGSCAKEDKFNGKTPLAKVYDSYLFFEDLEDLIPRGLSTEDSAAKVNNYINVWAKQQLMIKKAELNLTQEQKNVEKKLEEYRNNLLIYKYKDEFISQNLDTVVTVQQARDYYEKHQDDFKLNSSMVRVVCVLVDDEPSTIKEMKKLLEYKNDIDSAALIEYVKENAQNYNDFDGRWITLRQLCDVLPGVISERNEILKVHGIISLDEQDHSIWLVKIKDYTPVGSKTPFETARYFIEQSIINTRKNKLISELEKSIYDKAVTDGNLEYFNKPAQKTDQKND